MHAVELDIQTIELPSVYKDWTDENFKIELERVYHETAVERQWIQDAELKPYKTDMDIVNAVESGKLVRVGKGSGYLAIQRLINWDITRSDPDHQYHYSTPFVDRETFDCITEVASQWQSEMGTGRFLSVTSLGRSTPYQQQLGRQRRKLTIVGDGNISSHQVMRAFDLDGCGIVEETDSGTRRAINPRIPGFQPSLVAESRLVIKHLLDKQVLDGRINYVEELLGTQEHCFHVAVKPDGL